MKTLALVGVFCLAVGCGTEATEDAVETTQQAIKEDPVVTELFCTDCFEETSTGRPGSVNGAFVGGRAGSASGAAGGSGSTRVANPGDCPPDTDCVEAHGERRRPLADSAIRIAIVGSEKQVVYADLPGNKGIPDKIEGCKTRQEMYEDCVAMSTTSERWADFCRYLKRVMPGTPPHVTCWTKEYESRQNRENWCYEHFKKEPFLH